jgi:parvulin-like peptidyl-prolyl isomerase
MASLLALPPLLALALGLFSPRQEATVIARGKGLELSAATLERTLLERYGLSERGREILELLVHTKLIESLAAKALITVGQEDLALKWNELDREARRAGVGQGLQGELARKGVSPEDFRASLRQQILLERLVRVALERKADAPVSGDEQAVWLAQEIATRGFEVRPPPWSDGLVARCGEVEVRADELGAFLRRHLPEDDVRETAWHLLLLAGIEKRMPDVAREARARAIDEELARRRERHSAEFPAISFEQRLGALGRTVELLRSDPALEIAALSHLWVDRTSGADGLRKTYEAERAFFEGNFGRAAHVHMLFLVAGRFVNELQKRTFEQAEQELGKLAQRIGNLDDFAALSAERSEEPGLRAKKGDLGWVARDDARVPAAARQAVFALLDEGDDLPPGGRLLGPLRIEAGAALLWVSELRASPSWEGMSRFVHEELRRRFLEDVMPRAAVELRAAPEPPAAGGPGR